MFAAGEYLAQKVMVAVGVSKSKKSPQFEITMNITHQVEAGEWKSVEPLQERTIYLSLTDGAWPYTQKKLETLKFNGDFKNPDITDEFFAVNCEHDTYMNKTREKWDISGTVTSETEPPASDVLRALQDKWKTSTKPTGTPPPVPAPPLTVPGGEQREQTQQQAEPEQTTPAEDDMPF